MNTTTKLLPIYQTYLDANKVLGLPSLSFDKWIVDGLARISSNMKYGWTSHIKQS